MPDWELDWFGPSVVYSLVAAFVFCGLFIWWAARATRDAGKWF